MSLRAGVGEPPESGSGMTSAPPRRGMLASTGTAALLASIAGLLVVAAALIAMRVGPLEVHAAPYDPGPPRVIDGPTVPPQSQSFQAPQDQVVSSSEWLWWVGVVLAGLIGLAILLWLLNALRQGLRRPARPVVAGAGAPVAATAWSHLAEPSAADLGDERSFLAGRSADDIIASWELVESAADTLGFPRRESTTPTEFLREVTGELGDPRIDLVAETAGGPHVYDEVLAEAVRSGRSTAGSVLLHFYHRARFDTVALTPGAASAARRAARLLLDSWDLSRRQAKSLAAGAGTGGAEARR